MTEATAEALVDWCYAALTYAGLKGRRVVVFGHDSMGMETALAHVIPTRSTFGLEITRLDMKLLADMLNKKAYDAEGAEGPARVGRQPPGQAARILRDEADSSRFNQSLALYLIVRDLLADLNAVGGGFMSQLEWGSDLRGIPLPVADAMECFFNSTFDHNGPKPPLPFATEADVQGLLTMLFFTCAHRRQSAALHGLPQGVGAVGNPGAGEEARRHASAGRELWASKGLVDGDNSGTRRFDWAGEARRSVEEIMARRRMPLRRPGLLPRAATACTFVTPGGIEGIAGRLAYSTLSGMFSMVWDEAATAELPDEAGRRRRQTSTADLAAHVRRAEVRHDGRVQAVRPGQPLPHDPGPQPGAAGVLDGHGQRPVGLRLGRASRASSKASTARCRCSTC